MPPGHTCRPPYRPVLHPQCQILCVHGFTKQTIATSKVRSSLPWPFWSAAVQHEAMSAGVSRPESMPTCLLATLAGRPIGPCSVHSTVPNIFTALEVSLGLAKHSRNKQTNNRFVKWEFSMRAFLDCNDVQHESMSRS